MSYEQKSIITAVMHGCSCTKQEALEYLNSEVDNLKDYAEIGDLRYGDFRTACNNLGIDADYEEYFINQLAI